MYKANLMTLITLSSTHAGSGSGLRVIDLPIQREVQTNFPKIEASTIKGSIRATLEQKHGNCSMIDQLLGRSDMGEYASAVGFSDARLLFFPVKSMKGIFAWITCPMVLRRLHEDSSLMEERGGDWKELKESIKSVLKRTDHEALVTTTSNITFEKAGKEQVILEETRIDTVKSPEFTTLIERLMNNLPEEKIMADGLKSKAIMLPDDDFQYYVSMSTEIVTRIKVNNDTGIVENKGLFTEEYLPSESILYLLLFYSPSYKKDDNEGRKDVYKVRENFTRLFGDKGVFQIGAEMTLGKGIMRYQLVEGDKD